jgi:uncharacterized protein YndB with AHSA1/START domain
MPAFHHTRDFNAAAEAVFQALSDPVRLARWWGPDGFTNTIHTFEFKPGGHWDYTMHGPDGTDYPNQAVFKEILPNAGVVLQHVGQPRFMLSIALTPTGPGTRVSWVQEFEDPAMARNLRHIVEPANEQNLARWERAVLTFPKGGA